MSKQKPPTYSEIIQELLSVVHQPISINVLIEKFLEVRVPQTKDSSIHVSLIKISRATNIVRAAKNQKEKQLQIGFVSHVPIKSRWMFWSVEIA